MRKRETDTQSYQYIFEPLVPTTEFRHLPTEPEVNPIFPVLTRQITNDPEVSNGFGQLTRHSPNPQRRSLIEQNMYSFTRQQQSHKFPHFDQGARIIQQRSLSDIIYQDPSIDSNSLTKVDNTTINISKSKQRRNSAESSEIYDYQSASSVILPDSSSPGTIENEEEVDQAIYQIDDASMFTAIDHFDNHHTIFPGHESKQEDDLNSNDRHGYMPSSNSKIKTELIQNFKERLNLSSQLDWEDYKPKYRKLNENYKASKKDVYDEIYSTLKKIQELDDRFNLKKSEFQLDLEKSYESMSDNLLIQLNELNTEKEISKSSFTSNESIQFQSEKIRLNVGGALFETTLSTLRRDQNSLLAIMFSGRHAILAELDGSYFIDRDPSHFRYILNYLRDLKIPPAILQDSKIRQELLQEAKYYCVEGLVNTLETL